MQARSGRSTRSTGPSPPCGRGLRLARLPLDRPDDSDNSVLSFLRVPAPTGRPVACLANLTPVPRHDYRVGSPKPDAGQRSSAPTTRTSAAARPSLAPSPPRPPAGTTRTAPRPSPCAPGRPWRAHDPDLTDQSYLAACIPRSSQPRRHGRGGPADWAPPDADHCGSRSAGLLGSPFLGRGCSGEEVAALAVRVDLTPWKPSSCSGRAALVRASVAAVDDDAGPGVETRSEGSARNAPTDSKSCSVAHRRTGVRLIVAVTNFSCVWPRPAARCRSSPAAGCCTAPGAGPAHRPGRASPRATPPCWRRMLLAGSPVDRAGRDAPASDPPVLAGPAPGRLPQAQEGAVQVTCSTRCHSSSDMSVNGCSQAVPALATRQSDGSTGPGRPHGAGHVVLVADVRPNTDAVAPSPSSSATASALRSARRDPGDGRAGPGDAAGDAEPDAAVAAGNVTTRPERSITAATSQRDAWPGAAAGRSSQLRVRLLPALGPHTHAAGCSGADAGAAAPGPGPGAACLGGCGRTWRCLALDG